MQKIEFYKPTGLPGEKAVPSISVDADKLYGLLLRAELMESMASLEDGAEIWKRSIVKIERERRRKEKEEREGKGKGTPGSNG